MNKIPPWLHIIGIGEDGFDGLSGTAQELVLDAQVIIGGDRHHKLSSNATAERISWPSPFDAMIEKIRSFKGRKVVILVTGDPLWYSVGARISRVIDPDEIFFHPQVSAFQWASCRMGWSLPDVETLTVHGRPNEQIIGFVSPGIRMLVLSRDRFTPGEISALLVRLGYGKSRIVALGSLGGENETRDEGVADNWHLEVPDFHTLAIECIADENTVFLPRSGLSDDAFRHDGNITKRAVRAVTISKLVPVRNGLLWDVGCGCGSIAIEWMRSGNEARAIGIEVRKDRLEFAKHNANNLGAPALKFIDGRAPEALNNLPMPDAVFIGGGVSWSVIEICIAALKPKGRLVANCVTLEGESVLLNAYQKLGGELQRINVQSAEPLGSFSGWKNAMPVTQWSYCKENSQ